MAVSDPFAALAARPRASLAALPTPLEPARRLSEELGVEVWLKRDDVGSLGLAGNKVRKLEFAFGEALDQGARAVVTLGAPQSNHARTTAAAAARLGLPALLVMRGEDPGGPATGNLLLDALLGAEVRYGGTDDWAQLAAIGEALARERDGYFMPSGGSSPAGALGFVAAYAELLDQLDATGVAPRRIYHASSSCGTHAGLALGHALAQRGPQPLGFDVGRIVEEPQAVATWMAHEASGLLGAEPAPGASITGRRKRQRPPRGARSV